MAIYVMDKSYRVTTSGGVSAGRAVVSGGAGKCALPAIANASKILGITVTSQPDTGRSTSVRKAGTAEVVAAGPIAAGDPVNIADAFGRIKTVNEAAGTTVNCLGFAETAATAAGDMVEVFISIHQHKA